MALPLIQIARLLVRFDHVARLNRNHAYAVETRGVDVVALKKARDPRQGSRKLVDVDILNESR
jgi:hypothetical protein